jgi:Holliday junction resolvase RusA-like endonuclease
MIHLAAFEILGVPAPQGSKTKMPNGGMVEGSSTTGRAKHKAWRDAVKATALDIAESEPYDCPLQVMISFRMPMPKSRPAVARKVGKWPHAVKPDIDKLVRCTLDGLADGKLIVDDSRVFALEVDAWEVTGWLGAEVVLRKWEP